MFSIRIKRNKPKVSPHFRNAVKQALSVDIFPKESKYERGYFRPSSSLARTGQFVRAIGKPNTHAAGSKFARGTKSTVYSNLKKNH